MALSDDEVREIAEAVSSQLMSDIYREIGKSILNKIFWIFFALMIAAGVWMGIVSMPPQIQRHLQP